MPYNSNLAYDFDFKAKEEESNRKVDEHKRQKKAQKKAMRRRVQRTLICCLGICALCAAFMISRNVTAYESKRNVDKLQKELNSLKEYSSQKAFELDKSIDREEIEREARTRLNMVRPEKYQTVYVNIKQDDVTEVTVDDAEGIKNFFDIFTGKE